MAKKRRQPAGQFKQSAHLFDAFAVGDLGGNDFSAVDRRAAAKGHHALAVAAVIQSQTVFDIFKGGVGLNLSKTMASMPLVSRAHKKNPVNPSNRGACQ